MVKQWVNWKPVKCKNIVGVDVAVEIPKTIDSYYRGTLLSRILTMPKRTPIPFQTAINLASAKLLQALLSGQIGHQPGQYFLYTNNFVEWISELGHHIELTGDEFESYALSDRVA